MYINVGIKSLCQHSLFIKYEKGDELLKELIEIELVPVRKLFYNNSFGIYAALPKEKGENRVAVNDTYGTFTIKGKMHELTIDATYKAKLEEVKDPKYGLGYQVHAIYQDIPKTASEQKDFLMSMMTDLQVEAVYTVYPNADIIELFRTNKFDYNKVKGFGNITYERIKKKVLDNLDWQTLFAELGKYGIKYETLKKLVEYFGTVDNVIQKVNENPYCLCDLHGTGFKKADIIAKNMGIEPDSPFRIHAGIKYIIQEEQGSGHTYIERDDLLAKAKEFLGIDDHLIEAEIDAVEGLYIDGDKIALEKMYESEKYIAKRLNQMLRNSVELNIDIEQFLEEEQATMGIVLTEQQKGFFNNFIKYNVNFLVGYAGTGKSQLQKLLISLAKKMNMGGVSVLTLGEDDVSSNQTLDKGIEGETMTYRLLSPTGKAAKILAQYVGDPSASTIHRAIGYGMRKEDAAEVNLQEDIIIVDEASMLDVNLASVLLNKIVNSNARIVFVGDSAQIPSVSAGCFLKDCVDSGVFPVTELNHVFRQSEGGILDIATKVRSGQRFINDDFIGEKLYGTDTVFRSVQQEWMEQGYKHYYKKLLQEYAPVDIMVLSSTKKGNLGTVSINKNLQQIVNPSMDGTEEIKYHDDCTFRVNDYIINTKNTYNKVDVEGNSVDIVNGDLGTIVDIVRSVNDDNQDEEKEDKNGLYIEYDFGTVRVPFESMDQLLHAWSLTMHKSQGSAAKAVLVILDKAHKFQLNANLVYTAITRSREKLIILCQAETLNFAMRKFENMRRRTFLEGLVVMYSKVLNDK